MARLSTAISWTRPLLSQEPIIVAAKYGPWGIVAGGSDGTGIAFGHEMAERGINVILVARREAVLASAAEEIRASHGAEVRTVALDLAEPGAIAALAEATTDLEVGLLVYNAGADDAPGPFLDKDLAAHLAMVRRNCASVLEAAHRFGAPMVRRGRGGLVVVTSGAAWAGGADMAAYGATKAFDLILAEALWAEWQPSGVDVLALVLGKTDTPALRRLLEASGQPDDGLASPQDVARTALDHLADGPTWLYGSPDPAGASPLCALPRRTAVQALSHRTPASAKN
jgi:short-subunit dehydrogenase